MSFSKSHSQNFVKSASEGLNREKMLIIGIFSFEKIPDFLELGISFVLIEKFAFKFISPYSVKLKALTLKTSLGFELFIASHCISHPVQLHFSNPGSQSLLNNDIQLYGSFFSDCDAG
jgi:hypothetical protein